MGNCAVEGNASTASLHARRAIPHAARGFRRLTEKAAHVWRRATAPARAVPDFLIIGTMRGGTTALYYYLTQHPMVLPAFRKEVCCFDRSFQVRKHPIMWYRSFFPLRASLSLVGRVRKHRCLTGEATPSYLFVPTVPRRVVMTLPRVRLIALLRDPVGRALSHYFLLHGRKRERLPLMAALEAEEERIDQVLQESGRHVVDPRVAAMRYSYKALGVYVDQIKRWRAWFPPSQMLVLRSEDLFEEPQRVFSQVCEFLGLPLWEPPAFRRVYAGSYPAEDDEIRKATGYLREYFKPHNRRLFDYLGLEWDWPT